MVAAAEWALADSTNIQSLAELPLGASALVARVESHFDPSVLRRLAELGFLPGETLRVLARVPGGDPMAVRVGGSTFALRRHEARCIQVNVVTGI